MASPGLEAGDVSTADSLSPPPLRRRPSMEEDLLYHRIMTGSPRPPSHPPPPYHSSDRRITVPSPTMDLVARSTMPLPRPVPEELPPYSCSIDLEGVFTKKMEIEYTIKRAEDRRWHTTFVALHGTALDMYYVKKDWGLGKSRDGPTISPDNPPWIKRAKLEKRYSLLHADVGIAADYRKRRYVIRVRAESDQFLLSCVELSTFVKWLDALFAAINVAAPIDERDFPRDQSIPRIQRLRWFRGQPPVGSNGTLCPTGPPAAAVANELHAISSSSQGPSRPEDADTPNVAELGLDPGEMDGLDLEEDAIDEGDEGDEVLEEEEEESYQENLGAEALQGPSRRDPIHRLSTTSYVNEAVDDETGKWTPAHNWSTAHDVLYAKLCYSVLLFKSPRKSNYIIDKGKQWFVDWATGRQFRVLPPGYGDLEMYGPWQAVHTENRLI